MPEPGDYAEAAVVARAIKARLLRPEVVREAALASDFSEALGPLRDSIYSGLGDARTLSQAYSSIWSAYFRQVRRLAFISPAPASELLLSLEREEVLKDLLVLYQSVLLEKRVEVRLPSSLVGETLTRKVLEDPEALLSPQRFVEALSRSWAYAYLERAGRSFRELKGGPIALWAAPLSALKLYSEALSIMGGEGEEVERLLCPYLQEKALSSLLLAKVLEVPPRLLEDFSWGNLCGLKARELVELYAAEPDPLGIAGELKQKISIRAEGKSVEEVLASARKSARLALRERALGVMTGYPFRASFLLSPLLLLRLEAEDLTLLLSSKEYKLPPASVLPELGLEG
ncbi:MAG: V-type ATPase subunit [Acidilobaceae archaeon]